jgi:flagellar basal-body rod protein FlgB
MLDALHRDITWATLEHGMRGLSDRGSAVAENVANAMTPGYHRREVDFASGLREALAKSGDRGSVSNDVRDSEIASYVIKDEAFRNDLNGVDMMAEMALSTRISLDRAMSVSLMQEKLRMYKMVIRSGR